MFVAEAKFNDPQLHHKYVELIKKQDSNGILELLTNAQVEQRLLDRLRKKARIYGREIDLNENEDNDNIRLKPDTICEIYKQYVIPLTKDVEVEYLLHRLDVDFSPDAAFK